MMHDRVDAIDADPGTGGFAVPQPSVHALDFRDGRRLLRHPQRIVARQTVGDLLQVLKSHSDVDPVQKRRRGDAGFGENALKPGQSSMKAVNAVRSVRPTASRLRLINTLMSVSALATEPKTCRPPDFVSTLPTRTSRCRSLFSQLRMKVESGVTTTRGAIVSGVVGAQSWSISPTFRA
jgi:hypothetical protein